MTAEAIPLDQIDVNDPTLYEDDSIHEHFARLRQEALVRTGAAHRKSP